MKEQSKEVEETVQGDMEEQIIGDTIIEERKIRTEWYIWNVNEKSTSNKK